MDRSHTLDMTAYCPGEWVVHRLHGAGRIEGLEEKTIGNSPSTYCKIRSQNITYWLPIDKMNDDWLRPLASPAKIDKAFKILKSRPQPMSANLKSRKGKIGKVDSKAEPAEIAELLRDLWALKKKKKILAQVEERALRHFTNCFLAEVSVSLNLPFEVAESKFKQLLSVGRERWTDE